MRFASPSIKYVNCWGQLAFAFITLPRKRDRYIISWGVCNGPKWRSYLAVAAFHKVLFQLHHKCNCIICPSLFRNQFQLWIKIRQISKKHWSLIRYVLSLHLRMELGKSIIHQQVEQIHGQHWVLQSWVARSVSQHKLWHLRLAPRFTRQWHRMVSIELRGIQMRAYLSSWRWAMRHVQRFVLQRFSFKRPQIVNNNIENQVHTCK